MNVLLVGGGGREDALAWSLARSARVGRLRCAPGNAGIARRAEIVPLDTADLEAVSRHARAERYDLVVVGPEGPLVAGLTDRLAEAGVPVFGPSAGAARLEGSKAFAKRFMERHRIPTAAFHVADDVGSARAALAAGHVPLPLVVKADGLAAGKGVLFADDERRALEIVEDMMVARRFGDAGSSVVLEQRLTGREASFFVLSDGEQFLELATCQDYKRAADGDRGPNTGGMGSYSPSAYLTEADRRAIVDAIVAPAIAGMAAEGHPYRGVLYVGVMLTASGPAVLEFNVRFGDPETQALLPRLDGDWFDLLHACATGGLGTFRPRWRAEPAVCVVMAAAGYPGAYERGKPIRGLGRAEAMDGVEVFHAGTEPVAGGECVTAGGRVLGVTALGRDLAAARERAYAAVAEISWDGESHRTDIALDAVRRCAEGTRA